MSSTLAKVPRPVDQGEVQKCLLLHYGLRGDLRAITGERDYNFVLLQKDHSKAIVKIAHEDEDFVALDFQSQAVAVVQKNAPHLPISQEIKNLHNLNITQAQFSDGSSRFMRVNSFMPGYPLCDVSRNSATRKAIGELTATLATALKDFRHPAEYRVLLWDIQQAADLAPHVQTLSAGKRELVELFLNRFLERIAPLAPALRTSVIHNDLNLHNLFVDPNDHAKITGCIDFGDMVRAPLINDLAVASAYQMDATANPLSSIAETAVAYHAINPLLPIEIDHLTSLVAMRFVLTAVITHWRAQLHPANASYILRNAQAAWAGLAALAKISPSAASEYLYAQLKMKPDPAG